MRFNRVLLLALVATSLATALASGNGGAPPLANYAGAGTIVTSFNILQGQITVVDNGAVSCVDGDADGTYETGAGGACIKLSQLQGDSILVTDDQHGLDVAFQVCIDADGDNICGSDNSTLNADPLRTDARCSDLIFFSHSSFDGSFHNPLQLPSWFDQWWDQCEPAGFPGLVVITCAGIHRDAHDVITHTHDVTQGTVHSVDGGTGYGDFCGAPTAAKAYTLH